MEGATPVHPDRAAAALIDLPQEGAIPASEQQTPNGYHKLERLLSSAVRHGAEVGLCGTCTDARAVGDDGLIEGARRPTLDQLADWTLWADKVISF